MKIFLPACLVLLFVLSFISSVDAGEGKTPVIRLLIIDDETTGYYRWAGTAPLLKKSLNGSKQIEAVIVEDAEVLATDILFDYDVLLLHFKNYKPLKRDAKAKENLAKHVREGGGLFVYHFACGAFEDWPEFEKIAGRIWDPKLRAHDPYGKFDVHFIDKEHPIVKGLGNFETQDELYTCLKHSEVPIRILAEAKSKVDGKCYPMAFVLEYGKGRVFHTTLGHDGPSVDSAGFSDMMHNAVRWLAEK